MLCAAVKDTVEDDEMDDEKDAEEEEGKEGEEEGEEEEGDGKEEEAEEEDSSEDADSGPVERRPALKIRLPMFSQRRSTRERKAVVVRLHPPRQ